MRKVFSLFVSIVLAVSVTLTSCNKKGISKVTIVPLDRGGQELEFNWEEPDVNMSAKPYSINRDLSNISNISNFSEFNPYEKYKIYKSSFIIKKPEKLFDQPFNIYEENDVEGIPNFITTDSIIHIYNLMCSYITQSMEKERLVDELKEFTLGSLKKSLEVYNGTKEAHTRKAALKSIAYFGIAMKLLEMNLPGGIPLEANRIIDNDVKKVRAKWVSGTSEIFPYYIDYTKYTARGQYSKETDLRNYFLTMMWYGSTPMIFNDYDEKNNLMRLDEMILMSVIITVQTLQDENLRKLWDDIYRVSGGYLGNDCSLNIYDLSQIIKLVYGEKIDLNRIWSEEKIKKVYDLCKAQYREGMDTTIPGMLERLDKDNKLQVEFRLMNRIYNIDENIYDMADRVLDGEQKKVKGFPNGLYIQSAIGNDRASSILKLDMDDTMKVSKYEENIKNIRGILCQNIGNKAENYSINNSIYWILGGNSKLKGSYPLFMLSEEWQIKKLMTALSTVSESKCTDVMTARSGKAEASVKNRLENEMPGYVEPEVDMYGRMEYMAKYIRAFLSVNDFTDSRAYSALDDFIDSVVFLKKISIKELSSTPLTDEEEKRIKNYSRELRLLTLNVVDGKESIRHWEMVVKSDRSMSSMKDVYENEGQVLQTGIGYPDYIYVVVPYKEKLYMTRGSVFSYYEFIRPASKRLDDKEWKDITSGRKKIEQQDWLEKIKSN